jgi:hypothetical protein
MFRRPQILLLLAAVTACEPGVSERERASSLGAKVAEARCACTELQQLTTSRETCIEAEKRRWEADVLPALRKGTMSLDDDALDRCLSLLRSCAVQSYAHPPCSVLFEGHVADGYPCRNGRECESGVCQRGGCFEASAGHCAARLDGPGFCADNSFCADGLTCQGGGCAPALREGDPCPGATPVTTGCEPGLVCIPEEGGQSGRFTCQTQRTAGQRCGTADEAGFRTGFAACVEGFLCSAITLRCEAPVPPAAAYRTVDEPCTNTGEAACGIELVCSAGKCALPRRVAEACTSAEECASHVCRDGACRDVLDEFSCREP